jgi:hypothetical protein
MPRPKSEITAIKQIQVAVRVTASMKEEFKRIGGSRWLRAFLAKSIEERRQKEAK